jgi:hypothetical protein
MLGHTLAALAALVVWYLIGRAQAAGEDRKQERWDRKYRGRR